MRITHHLLDKLYQTWSTYHIAAKAVSGKDKSFKNPDVRKTMVSFSKLQKKKGYVIHLENETDDSVAADPELALVRNEAYNESKTLLQLLEKKEEKTFEKTKSEFKMPLKKEEIRGLEEQEPETAYDVNIDWLLHVFVNGKDFDFMLARAFVDEVASGSIYQWYKHSISNHENLEFDMVSLFKDSIPVSAKVFDLIKERFVNRDRLDTYLTTKHTDRKIYAHLNGITRDYLHYSLHTAFTPTFIRSAKFRFPFDTKKIKNTEAVKFTITKEAYHAFLELLLHIDKKLEEMKNAKPILIVKDLRVLLDADIDIYNVLTMYRSLPTWYEQYIIVVRLYQSVFRALTRLDVKFVSITSHDLSSYCENMSKSVVAVGKHLKEVIALREEMENKKPLSLEVFLSLDPTPIVNDQKVYGGIKPATISQRFDEANENLHTNIKNLLANKDKIIPLIEESDVTTYSQYYELVIKRMAKFQELLKETTTIKQLPKETYYLPYRLLPVSKRVDHSLTIDFRKLKELFLRRSAMSIQKTLTTPFTYLDVDFLSIVSDKGLINDALLHHKTMNEMKVYLPRSAKAMEDLIQTPTIIVYHVGQITALSDRYIVIDTENIDIYIKDVDMMPEHDDVYLDWLPPLADLKIAFEEIYQVVDNLKAEWALLRDFFVEMLKGINQTDIESLGVECESERHDEVVLRMLNLVRILNSQYPFKMLEENTAILFDLFDLFNLILGKNKG